jgi:hypothetical protein
VTSDESWISNLEELMTSELPNDLHLRKNLGYTEYEYEYTKQ